MFRAYLFEESLTIPRSITCKLNNTNPTFVVLHIFGPDGQVVPYVIDNRIRVFLDPSTLRLVSYTRADKSLCGLYASVVRNIFQGLERPFKVCLELRGLGYRMRINEGGIIDFFLGYSHFISFKLPPGISGKIVGSKARVLELTSTDWESLKQCAAKIRNIKKRNAYKEKGVFYKFEQPVLKGGKKKKFS